MNADRYFRALPVACLILTLLSGNNLPAFAAQVIIQAEPTSMRHDAVPGEVVRLAIRVQADAAAPVALQDALTLPAGWASVLPAGEPFAAHTGAPTLRLFAVQIPGDALAGQYELCYAVGPGDTADAWQQKAVVIAVLPVARVELVEDGTATAWIVAGDEWVTTLRAINRGNSPITVRLSALAIPQAEVELEHTTLELEPGEVRNLLARVRTDPQLAIKRRQIIRVRAEATDARGAVVRTDSRYAAEILPRGGAPADAYLRLPVRLDTQVTYSSRDGTGVRSVLGGAGYLDQENRYKLDFTLSGPAMGNSVNPILYEEYRVRIEAPGWSLQLGDGVYTLSPLTQQYSYGRGVGLTATPGPLETGIYYLQSRWKSPVTHESGAYVRGRVGETGTLGANLLHREHGVGLRDAIASIDGSIRGARHAVEVEYAVSHRSDSGGDDAAVRIDAQGMLARTLHYSAGWLHAGPDFQGYYRDFERTHASLNAALGGGWRSRLGYHRLAYNLERDPRRAPQATTEEANQGGVIGSLWQGGQVSIDLLRQRRVDHLRPGGFAFAEHSVRLGAGHRFARWNVRGHIEFGELNDTVRDATHALFRYSVYITFRPDARHNYTAYFRGGDAILPFDNRRTNTAGINGQWKLSEQVVLNAQYGHNEQSRFGVTHHAHQAGAGIMYKLPRGHEARASAYWSRQSGDGQDQVVAYFSYSVPWKAPVRRLRGSGRLEGKVRDADTPGQPGLPGVIVSVNGSSVVTDSAGRYAFPNLRPGVYTLRIDQASLGASRTTTETQPRVVEIFADLTEVSNIWITTTAALTGRILVAAEDEVAVAGVYRDVPTVTALRGIIIEIRRGPERYRTVTDATGRYAFPQLRPGNWSITVLAAPAQANYRLAPDADSVDLAPGKASEVNMQLSPRIRTLHLIDEGTIR